jgi:hypothetical protein
VLFSLAVTLAYFIILAFYGLPRTHAIGLLVGVSALFGELSVSVGNTEEKIGFLLLVLLVINGELSFGQRTIKENAERYVTRTDLLISQLFLAYLTVQSVRSILVYSRSPGSLFWPVAFAIATAAHLRKGKTRLIHGQESASTVKIGRIVVMTLATYEILIIVSYISTKYGILNESSILPFKSALLFPSTCLAPLVYLHSRYDKIAWRRAAIVVSVMGLYCSAILSSRASLVPLLLFFVASFAGQMRRAIAISTTVIFALLAVTPAVLTDAIQTVQDSVRNPEETVDISGAPRDYDRIVHYIASFELAENDRLVALFGVGFRLAGVYLAPSLADYYRMSLPGLDFEVELGSFYDSYTFGWNGLLTDLGFVGILLILALVWSNASMIIKHTNGLTRLVFFLSLAVFVARLFTNSYSGQIMFYLFLIPTALTTFTLQIGDSLMGTGSDERCRMKTQQAPSK